MRTLTLLLAVLTVYSFQADAPKKFHYECLQFVPAAYEKDPVKRWPLLLCLHGSGERGTDPWQAAQHGPPKLLNKNATLSFAERAIVPKLAENFIVLAPQCPPGAVWENDALLALVDDAVKRLRVDPQRIYVTGLSMGGYGTWVIGMRYPEMFNAIYAQSACCGLPRTETVESAQKLSSVPIEQGVKADFGTRAALASMVAWSPNPKNPPYFADPPFKDGKVDQLVMAEWANNSPLAMIPSHVWALKSYKAIGSDVGTKDGLIRDDTAIHEMLDKQGIANTWATYEGTHVDHIAQRFDEVVLPFFAQHLTMK